MQERGTWSVVDSEPDEVLEDVFETRPLGMRIARRISCGRLKKLVLDYAVSRTKRAILTPSF